MDRVGEPAEQPWRSRDYLGLQRPVMGALTDKGTNQCITTGTVGVPIQGITQDVRQGRRYRETITAWTKWTILNNEISKLGWRSWLLPINTLDHPPYRTVRRLRRLLNQSR